MKLVVCLLLLCGLVHVKAAQKREGPQSTDDDALTDYLLEVLKMFAEYLPVGIPALGIPPMDPFSVPPFDIPTINQQFGTINLDFAHLVLSGLSKFSPTYLDASLTNLTLTVEVTIPLLKADAEYSLDGTLFGVVPLYGNGHCWVHAKDITIFCDGRFILIKEKKLQVSSLILDASFGAIKVHFDNLMGGDNLGESINNLVSATGVIIFEKVKPLFMDDLTKALRKVINDQLSKVDVDQIITGDARPSPYKPSPCKPAPCKPALYKPTPYKPAPYKH